MSERVYLTTTLPYVNAEPHIGFAAEIVRADIIARYHRLMGRAVFLNTGTDEHGLKIYQKAVEQGREPGEYVNEFAEKFKNLRGTLGLIDDINFIRTTDPHHVAAAQAFWQKCDQNGFIYKKQYQIKYCVGCELEKTDSELENGRCPIHPNLELELIDEENYFFKFSAFQDRLLALYEAKPDFVVPSFRFNEIKSFVSRGLEDFSISRLKAKMPWGVPVPGDDDQVMYVWFDALVNYISAIGWPVDLDKFNNWWPVVQFAGKDNLRQQSAMWQAMLMAAGLPPSKQIVINGFIVGAGGQKMSKSLGNVINPYQVVSEYGTEALRYFLASQSPFEDTPVTLERIKEVYNGELANGLGNLVSRVMKMAATHLSTPVSISDDAIPDEWKEYLEKFEIHKSLGLVTERISNLDRKIQETEPFKLVKTDPEAGRKIITEAVVELYAIGQMLGPFMPGTSATILQLIKENKSPAAPLFLRKD